MTIVLQILTPVARRAKANFVHKTRKAQAVQENLLRELLLTHKDTELGRKYQLGEIKTIEQFRERIPILPYSSYEPYMERIAAGEQNLLTPEPVVYLTLTSGSVGWNSSLKFGSI